MDLDAVLHDTKTKMQDKISDALDSGKLEAAFRQLADEMEDGDAPTSVPPTAEGDLAEEEAGARAALARGGGRSRSCARVSKEVPPLLVVV